MTVVTQSRLDEAGTPVRTPEIRAVDASADPETIVRILLEDGAVIVHNFISQGQVDQLNAELEPANKEATTSMKKLLDFYERRSPEEVKGARPEVKFDDFRTAWEGRTKIFTGLAAISPTWVSDIILHPTNLAICDRLFLPTWQDYLVGSGILINVGPGAGAQPIHRDQGSYAGVPGQGVGSNLIFGSMIALSEFTEENGATQIVPGSHRWEGTLKDNKGRVPRPEDITQAVMPIGSCVFYLGWTFHGAGANRSTDKWRRGLHISYVPGWLRTSENFSLSTPIEVVRKLPERAQELLGFGVYENLGMVGLRRPIDQMKDGRL